MRYLAIVLLSLVVLSSAQDQTIPAVHSNLHYDENGKLILTINDSLKIPAAPPKARYTLSQMIGSPQGTEKGISFDFKDPEFNGIMYFGFIPYQDSRHPQPVYLAARQRLKQERPK